MGSGETYSNDIGEETTMNTDGQLPEVKKNQYVYTAGAPTPRT